ncbi:hypothetical protein [Planktotalea sp.]|uniref:alginate O-acetyltransferase AlgX-related protein n=1 Tax=Planktotalea sp. TaxID=2029877 RepID=UPI003296F074
MKQDTGKRTRRFWRVLKAGACALTATLAGQTVHAQSAYDCRNLTTHGALPAVEGKNGNFFSIRPELQAHHNIADPSIKLIAELQNALAARGTTLIVLPIPTRAQVLAHHLPAMAEHVGHDPALAMAVYENMIERMKAAGLTVADPLNALRTSARNGDRPFFETDPRPTAFGMQLLAETVSDVLERHPNARSLNRGAFRSTVGTEVTLPSAMRLQLQTACQSELPQVKTRSYATVRDDVVRQPEADEESTLVVLGTDITSTPALNLPGFLSEETGLKALSYGLKDGGAFAALASYMTSRVFQTTRPDVLVWELPITASLADHGSQPLRELIYAAKNSCETAVPLVLSPQGDRLFAKLDQVPLGEDQALLFDAGETAMSFAKFHFADRDGIVRTRSIYRNPDQIMTGRFFLPLSSLRREEMSSVGIEGAARFDASAQLLVCS